MNKKENDKSNEVIGVYALFFISALSVSDGRNEGFLLIMAFVLATVFMYLIRKFNW